MSLKNQLPESRLHRKYVICSPWNLITQKVGKFEAKILLSTRGYPIKKSYHEVDMSGGKSI